MAKMIEKSGKMTPKPDKEGITVHVCDPGWFDKSKVFKIQNAPARTAALELTGSDLNFTSRVLYAEASGAKQLADKTERNKQKQAILNVKHFRLNRAGYPNRVKAQTFSDVCTAPGQFESVYGSSPKFSGSAPSAYESLNKLECSDLEEAIAAVKYFIEH